MHARMGLVPFISISGYYYFTYWVRELATSLDFLWNLLPPTLSVTLLQLLVFHKTFIRQRVKHRSVDQDGDELEYFYKFGLSKFRSRHFHLNLNFLNSAVDIDLKKSTPSCLIRVY